MKACTRAQQRESYNFFDSAIFRGAMLREIYLALAVALAAFAQTAVTEANCTDSRLNWVSVNQLYCRNPLSLTYLDI